MKALKTLLFIIICTASYIGCNKDRDNDVQDNIALTGTKWKLAALVDVQAHESIKPEPKNCNTCYTLEFVSDTMAIGKSVSNTLHFIVTRSTIEMFLATEIGDGDQGNVGLFYEALQTLDTYEYNEEEFKIYYDKNKYLLYKPLLQ
ncbi:MAG: hypothetical protein LBC19_06990 [Tannerella sp.]|jgi:hypothetical protein|nr:hypothetical protein [Tannerella sp.]